MKKLILIGNGGHAKVVKDVAEAQGVYHVVGYLDDAIEQYYEDDSYFYDHLSQIGRYSKDHYFCIAIGNNTVREQIFNRSGIDLKRFATLVHPTATISPSVEIEIGTVVMAAAVINADTKIGKHAIINTGAVVEHDNQIGDYVHISPHATLTGGVSVAQHVHIGASATLLPSVKVAENVVVGAGATVVKNIEPNLTVIGTPAKPRE